MKESLEKEALAAVELEAKINMAKTMAQLELQKKQLEVQAELQLYQAMLQKKMTSKHPELFGGAEQPQEQSEPVEEFNQTPSNIPPGTQSAEPQQQPQTINTNEINEEAQKVALQLIKLPAEYRQKVLQTLPQSAQQKVMLALNSLESATKMSDKAKVDMRPLPEQKPPRRDSLK
jgi:hypothetical protein